MNENLATITLHEALDERCRVERVLGRGGFSTVYLVREQQDEGKLFALKELRNQGKSEKARFRLEAELLMRLSHPALPSVYHHFEKDDRAYMLMEYIDGPNLEELRKQQVKQRFSIAEVCTLLQPIVDALSYIHTQEHPIIHRDIKPSNIIVPAGNAAVLVDFGLAKAYEPDATTNAIRQCTPGYGAPEQYSTEGSDVRTDVYGFAATCYTLLCGSVPVDSFIRTTQLVTKQRDPLLPLQHFEPDISERVEQVILQALAIDSKQRFANVEEFWLELQRAAKAVPKQKRRPSRLQRIALIVGTGLLLVASGTGFFVYDRWSAKKPVDVLAMNPTQKTVVTPSPTKPSMNYPVLAADYKGTMVNLETRKSMNIALTGMEQQSGTIKGTFESEKSQSSFDGVQDMSLHVFFTVKLEGGKKALFFQGSLRDDGHLVGSYCRIDGAGQCIGEYGMWSVGPVKTPEEND